MRATAVDRGVCLRVFVHLRTTQSGEFPTGTGRIMQLEGIMNVNDTHTKIARVDLESYIYELPSIESLPGATVTFDLDLCSPLFMQYIALPKFHFHWHNLDLSLAIWLEWHHAEVTSTKRKGRLDCLMSFCVNNRSSGYQNYDK